MLKVVNPQPCEIRSRYHLGDINEAARIAGVKPATIRVWISRGKLRPADLGDNGSEVFHLPTVAFVADQGAKHRPPDPAANSRGPHKKRAPKAA
jgi:hypothetical protein